MKRVMFLLLLAMAIASEVQAQTWPNEPAGATVISDWDWRSCPGGGWYPAYGCGAIVSDPTAPTLQTSVLEFRRDPAPSCNGGCGGDPYVVIPSSREVYTAFWWKLSNPFLGHSNLYNKISFLFTEGVQHGQYYTTAYGPRGGPFVFLIDFEYPEVCNRHLGGECPGALILWSNVSNPSISLGQWHRIEIYNKVSTSSTSRDGIIRWWIDGQLAGNYTTVNFPDQARFSSFFFTPSWDGPDPGVWEQTSYHRFDHVRVSTSGSVGTPKGDTTPPAAPTSLRAY